MRAINAADGAGGAGRLLREEIFAARASTSALGQLLATNLMGHPTGILPNGFREDGSPVWITFPGNRVGEAHILALGHAYQGATDFHRRQPMLAG